MNGWMMVSDDDDDYNYNHRAHVLTGGKKLPEIYGKFPEKKIKFYYTPCIDHQNLIDPKK
ncbi:hypothetical protein DERP_010271 [Dermatophagoides pteronyssinus]|uniref:Uncharacterized protein n=1 Tax=Dermatophagoides pteronyssinus TaxID=6956 RepID=A0ABQ8IYM1_DERPT|nr:hypothetical protein DERP_010271 [Dermatophagoides pteronyssinus]